MADSTNTPSGDEKASAETSNTKDLNPAELQKQVQELQAKLEKEAAERKKANDEAASYRVKEREAREKKQIEDGQSKELAESLRKELDETKKLADERQSRLDKIEADTRAELLARLPENIRDEYKEFGLDALRTVSKHLAIVPPPGNSQGSDRGASSNGAVSTPKTQEEMYELLKSNPAAFDNLIKKQKG